MILQRKTPSVLDVGCGCGTESLWFAKLGASVWGIDLISSHIAVAEERKAIMEELLNRKLSCKFSLDSVFDLGKSGEQFDIIWMEQTFHHIEPREDVTRILGSLLKDDGTVIISESNAWNPLIQMGVFKLRGTKTVIDLEIDGKTYKWGHERILTPRSLVKTLRLGGFSADAHSYFRLLPSNKIFDKISWIESIWPRFLFPAFTHYNITARKTARASN
jgi:2-polyprenyl-3-methyl-5-hydroxy-6-metoxy-1,4-benzoquinol methylase